MQSPSRLLVTPWVIKKTRVAGYDAVGSTMSSKQGSSRCHLRGCWSRAREWRCFFFFSSFSFLLLLLVCCYLFYRVAQRASRHVKVICDYLIQGSNLKIRRHHGTRRLSHSVLLVGAWEVRASVNRDRWSVRYLVWQSPDTVKCNYHDIDVIETSICYCERWNNTVCHHRPARFHNPARAHLI